MRVFAAKKTRAAAYTECLTTAFLSPAASSASSLTKARHRSTNERRRLERVDIVRSPYARGLSHLPVVVHRHDRQATGRRELLAVHELRRGVERLATRERVAVAKLSAGRISMAVTRTVVVRELFELIEALERRVPQVQRAGEASIARDAMALKARALKRIEELEREQSLVEEI
jgi:hypothetical protein